MAIFNVKRGLQAAYDALAEKSLDTLYFTTDEGRIFIGDKEYAPSQDLSHLVPIGTEGDNADTVSYWGLVKYVDGRDSAIRSELAGLIDAVEGKVDAIDLTPYALASDLNTLDGRVDAVESGKVDKEEGKSLISNTEIERLANVDNYDDSEVRGLISGNTQAISDINDENTGILKQAKDYADNKDAAVKAELIGEETGNPDDDTINGAKAFATEYWVGAGPNIENLIKEVFGVENIGFQDSSYDTENSRIDILERDKANASDVYTKTEADAKYATKGEDSYDDTELTNRIAAEETRAKAAEEALGGRIDDEASARATAISGVETLVANEKTRAEAAEAQVLDDAKAYTDAEITGLEIVIEKKDSVDFIVVKNKAGVEVASVDATAFVKDGMLTSAVYNTETNKLTLTWNTDSGIQATDIDLNDLVDTYIGGNGINVATNGEISIDTEVVATVSALNEVKATAEAAQTAQEVSDAIDDKIANLATKTELANEKKALQDEIDADVKVEADRAVAAEGELSNRIKDLEDNKAGYATTGAVATAKSEAIAEATRLDGALKTELQAEIDADVKVVADDLAEYVTSNDAALANVKATAEAARTEEEVNSQIDAKIANLASDDELASVKSELEGKITASTIVWGEF